MMNFNRTISLGPRFASSDMYAYYGLSTWQPVSPIGYGNAQLSPGHYPNMSIGEFQQMMASRGPENKPKTSPNENVTSVNQQFGFLPEDKDC